MVATFSFPTNGENVVSTLEADEKACPYCGEPIKAIAILCKHCKSSLTETPAAQKTQTKAANRADGPERTIYEGKLHWLIYLWPAFWFLNFGYGLVQAIATKSDYAGVSFLLILIPTIYLVAAYLRQASSVFRITNQRVFIQTGIIAKNTTEIPLHKIETVSVAQGVIGKSVDCGDVQLTGTGSSAKPLRKLTAPNKFRDALSKAMNENVV